METVWLDVTNFMSLTSQSKLQRPFGGPPDCFESRGGGAWLYVQPGLPHVQV